MTSPKNVPWNTDADPEMDVRDLERLLRGNSDRPDEGQEQERITVNAPIDINNIQARIPVNVVPVESSEEIRRFFLLSPENEFGSDKLLIEQKDKSEREHLDIVKSSESALNAPTLELIITRLEGSRNLTNREVQAFVSQQLLIDGAAIVIAPEYQPPNARNKPRR